MKVFKWLAFGTLVVMLVGLAAATVIEKVYGFQVAHEWFYDNITFVALWTVIATCGIIYIVARCRLLNANQSTISLRPTAQKKKCLFQ